MAKTKAESTDKPATEGEKQETDINKRIEAVQKCAKILSELSPQDAKVALAAIKELVR